MLNKKKIKVFIGIIIACLIIISSYKAYNYLQRNMLLEKASSTAEYFNFKFKLDVGYMPTLDKKSLENLNNCMDLLKDAYKNDNIYSATVTSYAEYICNQYRNGKFDYIIYFDNNPNSKYDFKYILTTQKSNLNLTKKLNLEIE